MRLYSRSECAFALHSLTSVSALIPLAEMFDVTSSNIDYFAGRFLDISLASAVRCCNFDLVCVTPRFLINELRFESGNKCPFI